ncbi:hypothetical protein V8C86DRAFT_2626950 [Haematococcus lacustris]
MRWRAVAARIALLWIMPGARSASAVIREKIACTFHIARQAKRAFVPGAQGTHDATDPERAALTRFRVQPPASFVSAANTHGELRVA